MADSDNGIVLYHYSFSPYARRVTWYLALRGIGYAECVCLRTSDIRGLLTGIETSASDATTRLESHWSQL